MPASPGKDALPTHRCVLITGASSGIGRAAAQCFQRKGWTVIATMRAPAAGDELAGLERVIVLPLDVTSPQSIESCIDAALARCGSIDVLVNNAGYGLLGAFEDASPQQVERQFATNVLGLMNTTRAMLPHFRARRAGTIVNLSSVVGRIGSPGYTLYAATKWAVEGFSESLQYEVETFNVRVKLIEPGAIKTDFAGRSLESAGGAPSAPYQSFVAQVMSNLARRVASAPPPEIVADVIYAAVTDGSARLRYPVNARRMLTLRRWLPDGIFHRMMRRAFLRRT